MKNKHTKIIAALLSMTLIVFLLLFVNSWVGNPLSKTLAKGAAEKYIAEYYPDLNLEVSHVGYNFKLSSYFAFCQSPTSIDTGFSVFVDNFGNVMRDNYEYEVANNFTTWRRLDNELRQKGNQLLRNQLDYEINNALFSFSDISEEEMLTLTKDMVLDIYNPPLDISASIYIIDPDVSYEKMAEVLVTMATVCNDANIPISTYSVSIEYGTKERQSLSLYHIPVDTLSAEDLPKALSMLDSN